MRGLEWKEAGRRTCYVQDLRSRVNADANPDIWTLGSYGLDYISGAPALSPAVFDPHYQSLEKSSKVGVDVDTSEVRVGLCEGQPWGSDSVGPFRLLEISKVFE